MSQLGRLFGSKVKMEHASSSGFFIDHAMACQNLELQLMVIIYLTFIRFFPVKPVNKT